MSNNIYDILGKLNGLTPKENPVSTASGPLYESVAPRGDIIGGIKALNEKYYKAQNQPQAQKQQSDNVRYQSDNPLVKGFLQRAYQEFPNSANDNEAIVALMAKDKQQEDQIDAQANEWMQQAKSKIDTQQDKMNDMAQVIIDQEKRFQDFNKEVAASKMSPQDKAKAAGEFAKVNKTSKDKTDAAAKGKQIIDKAKADSKDKNKDKEEYVKLKDEPEQDAKAQDEVPANTEPVADKSADKEVSTQDNSIAKMVQQLSTAKDKEEKKSAAELQDQPTDPKELEKAQALAANSGFEDEPEQPELPGITPANDDQYKNVAETADVNNIPVDQETLDNVPMLRQKLRKDVRDFMIDPKRTMLTLSYPGGRNVQYPRQTILRLAEILTTMDPAKKQNFFDNVLPSADRFTAFIDQLKTEGDTYYFYKVSSPEQIMQAKTLKLGQTKNGSWYSPNFPNPQAEKLFGPGRKWTAPSKQQTQESKNFLGNDNMSNNIYNILGRFNNLWKTESTETVVDLGEPVYQVYESVEANGDITEAVRSLESKFETYKNEVSEGKKLKDKEQFDDVAEKGDYYITSKGNKVIKTDTGVKHEKVHAGDDDKDDLDEGAKPDFLDVDKDGDKKEPFKKAVKDKEQVDELVRVKPRGNALSNRFHHDDTDGQRRATAGAVKVTRANNRADGGPTKGVASGHDPLFSRVSTYNNPLTKAFARKGPQGKTVEEATEFGDTIKNSAGKMTKVTEGKDAIRNHPIYTTKEAWDHYAEELAEQEMMDEALMAPPVIDAVQELDEIARLSGIKYTPKCESCGCAESACKCGTLDESMSRKDYRSMADEISQMENRDDAKRLAHKYAVIAKKDNSRFKEDMFFAACGLDIAECGMTAPATIVVGEDKCPACDCAPCKCDEGMMEAEMDEGNEFTKARLDAIAQGKDTFTVGDKIHNVTGDTSDEKQQVEESTLVTEDVNVNVTANGEEDVVKLIQKLAGMPVIAIQAPQQAEEPCGTCGASPCGCEEVVDEQRDIEWDNTPEELTAPISAAIPSGTDLNRSKRQDPATANKAANPLGESQVEESLWKAYEEIINDVKA
jgi:hypothetical protein